MPSGLSCRTTFFTLLLRYIFPVSAILRNVSIDDTYGDPTTGEHFVYTPAQAWNNSQTCDRCASDPDLGLSFDQTWHEATTPTNPFVTTNATVKFQGTALYVYCILSYFSQFWGNIDMTFYIDGEVHGSFVEYPPNTPNGTYHYSTLVFFTDALSQENHTFTLVNGEVTKTRSLVVLDYIQYTWVTCL
ncbi:hypothetical protein OBBRIDRAFT_726328 [Obba rivulosa]|uniref:Uncharacterized protein n=1 Tax=Obba rivulosa TaxID=1052685 RepID=A0A8E2B281_9APHY|nr:hypothetical protein OBBRIDRAFT_726328 [Obba rivulosa]